MPRSLKLRGVGIDILELARARRFFLGHQKKIKSRLLTPAERRSYLRKKFSVLEFAKNFSAKEAFFKALGRSWMGIEGFSSMQVKSLPCDQFQVELLNSKEQRLRAQGSFFYERDYVGAQVVVWES